MARIVASSPIGTPACQARRSANPRASPDAGSTHWRSSMATMIGRTRARSRRTVRVAIPTTRGSTGAAWRSSNRAAASPSDCGLGRSGRMRSTTGPSRSVNTTSAMAASDSTARATSTVGCSAGLGVGNAPAPRSPSCRCPARRSGRARPARSWRGRAARRCAPVPWLAPGVRRPCRRVYGRPCNA